MQFTGKSVEEAIELGLKELNLTEEQVEVAVIEQPVKGLFGRLKGKAVVEITKKEQPVCKEEKVIGFVENLLDMMGLNAVVDLEEKENSTVITLTASDSSNVIGPT